MHYLRPSISYEFYLFSEKYIKLKVRTILVLSAHLNARTNKLMICRKRHAICINKNPVLSIVLRNKTKYAHRQKLCNITFFRRHCYGSCRTEYVGNGNKIL